MSQKNLAVFISGQGSNLEVILNNKKKRSSLFVVSSSPAAYGLSRAKNHRVPYKVLGKPIDWQALHQALCERQVDLIFCAGFMKIIPAEFIELWQGRLFNLHPSMLPKYRGLKAIEQAYREGDDIGVSIHHIVPEIDAGEVILQDLALPAGSYKGQSLGKVTSKVQVKEHELVARWIDLVTS